MDDRQRQLLERIDRAFAGVELGDGVSLHETYVVDAYGTAEERRAAREPDEKHDWHRLINDPDLPVYLGIGYGGLSFLDAAGVRFHLPACLSRVVRDPEDERIGNLTESLCYLLTSPSEYNADRLAILTDDQRACVRDVLVYFREAMVYDGEELDQAIDGYWSRPAAG
ncbi:MAG TPA: DUF6714 family protein [Rhodothermales bacterium]|nr:DUF6714 family protein [Rhodothermales bacterium]